MDVNAELFVLQQNDIVIAIPAWFTSYVLGCHRKSIWLSLRLAIVDLYIYIDVNKVEFEPSIERNPNNRKYIK